MSTTKVSRDKTGTPPPPEKNTKPGTMSTVKIMVKHNKKPAAAQKGTYQALSEVIGTGLASIGKILDEKASAAEKAKTEAKAYPKLVPESVAKVIKDQKTALQVMVVVGPAHTSRQKNTALLQSETEQQEVVLRTSMRAGEKSYVYQEEIGFQYRSAGMQYVRDFDHKQSYSFCARAIGALHAQIDKERAADTNKTPAICYTGDSYKGGMFASFGQNLTADSKSEQYVGSFSITETSTGRKLYKNGKLVLEQQRGPGGSLAPIPDGLVPAYLMGLH